MDTTFVDREQPRLLEELFELLRIPSVSSLPEHAEDCRRAAEWLRAELTRLAGHGYFDGTRLTAEGLAYSDAIGPWLVSPGVRAAMSGYAAR